jgi:hypothetical protein
VEVVYICREKLGGRVACQAVVTRVGCGRIRVGDMIREIRLERARVLDQVKWM